MILEYQQRTLLKLNYRLFIDMMMLRFGSFNNVQDGTSFYDGSDMSVMIPDTNSDRLFFGAGTVGRVWQSAFRQWVYEENIVIDSDYSNGTPLLPSGITVNGNIVAENDATFGYVVDYLNGRIIFNNAQDIDTTEVRGNFAYRDVRVDFEHSFNQQFRDGYLESKFMTNPGTSNNLIYPSGTAQPFPAIFIEIADHEQEPYEMGNRSLITINTIRFHIWTLDDLSKDNIIDILTSQGRKTLPIIDFNLAPLPLSGIFNAKSFEYITYQQLLTNNEVITTVGSGIPIKYLSYIEDVTARNLQSEEEYERAIVDYKVKTYLNAPTTPLGNFLGRVSETGRITDPPV